MNTPVMITVLCGMERDGWINPELAQSLFAAMQDCNAHQRGVGVNLVCGVRPIGHARNEAVAKFLKSPCQWLVQIDNDQYPRFRILDLIKAAEDASKYIVGAPTPCVGKHGRSWNATEKGPDDFYRTLPEGWFKPFLIGSGLLAVRRTVFEKMTPPWFDTWAEDFAFCIKAQDAGFKVTANSKFICSHFHTCDLLDLMPA
jgi:GT2 family glycosyltransferase